MVYYRRKKKINKVSKSKDTEKRIGIKNKMNKNVNKQKRNQVDNKKLLLSSALN